MQRPESRHAGLTCRRRAATVCVFFIVQPELRPHATHDDDDDVYTRAAERAASYRSPGLVLLRHWLALSGCYYCDARSSKAAAAAARGIIEALGLGRGVFGIVWAGLWGL